MSLQALQQAVAHGTSVGALIHEKTAAAWRVEVLAVEDDRVLALACADGEHEDLFRPENRVRLELPKETSVVLAPGRVTRVQARGEQVELELDCHDGAEDRQRRMDVRVSAACRIHLRESDTWLSTRTVNVSAGGALVADGDPTHAGDVVDVELELDGDTFRCQAEVLRRGVKLGGVSSRTNAALRFVGLPQVQRDRLALRLLAQRAREKAARHRTLGHGTWRPDEGDEPE